MFQDLDTVKLKRDIIDVFDSTGRQVSVPAGTCGTIVIVFSSELGFPANDPLDYEVEFLDDEGHTLGLLQISENDLELESAHEERKNTAF